MGVALTTETKFYDPRQNKNSSTLGATINRIFKDSSTAKLKPHYYYNIQEHQKQMKNIKMLRSFTELLPNWNDNGALPFSSELIEECITLIDVIDIQPEVFPTGRQSIQFEYEKETDEYLEFEIFEDKISVFLIDEDDLEKDFTLPIQNKAKINKHIRDFHEKRI